MTDKKPLFYLNGSSIYEGDFVECSNDPDFITHQKIEIIEYYPGSEYPYIGNLCGHKMEFKYARQLSIESIEIIDDDIIDFDIFEKQRKKIDIYRRALRKIYKWFGEFPESNEFMDDKTRQSFLLEHPNIKKDIEYMRKIAKDAIKNI